MWTTSIENVINYISMHYECIGIDDAHYVIILFSNVNNNNNKQFDDMTKWTTLLANYGKVVIVAGLNGDAYQKVSENKHTTA